MSPRSMKTMHNCLFTKQSYEKQSITNDSDNVKNHRDKKLQRLLISSSKQRIFQKTYPRSQKNKERSETTLLLDE